MKKRGRESAKRDNGEDSREALSVLHESGVVAGLRSSLWILYFEIDFRVRQGVRDREASKPLTVAWRELIYK
jgi:hypothetical protein